MIDVRLAVTERIARRLLQRAEQEMARAQLADDPETREHHAMVAAALLRESARLHPAAGVLQ
jgi:hypothetical protein